MKNRLNRLIFVILIWPYYWVRIHLWWALRNKPENQLADIGRLIDMRPDYAPFYLRRAGVLAHLHKHIEQGFADCDTAQRLNPALEKDHKLYVTRSYLYLAQDDLDAALAQLDLAIKADPTVRATYFFRAMIHCNQGNFQQTIADYRQGLKYDFGLNRSQYVEIYARIADAYIAMHDFQKASDEIEKAAHYSPTHMAVTLTRISVYANQCDVEGVDREIAKILPRKKHELSHAIGARGFAHLIKYDYVRAIQDAEQATALNPTEHLHFVNRAAARIAQGDVDTALQEMQSAVDMAPKSPMAHNGLGYAHLLQGKLAEAEHEFEVTLRLLSTYEAAHNGYGHLHLMRGDYAAALRSFERAVKGHQGKATHISGQAGQAVSHYALDDADTAVAQWRALCERHDDRDMLVYLREIGSWPPKSLELAAQLNALVFP